MNVKTILKDWLTEHSYDGLVHVETECGCDIKEFPLGECRIEECQPAYHRDCCDCPIEECSMRSDNIGCFHPEKLANR